MTATEIVTYLAGKNLTLNASQSWTGGHDIDVAGAACDYRVSVGRCGQVELRRLRTRGRIDCGEIARIVRTFATPDRLDALLAKMV